MVCCYLFQGNASTLHFFQANTSLDLFPMALPRGRHRVYIDRFLRKSAVKRKKAHDRKSVYVVVVSYKEKACSK